MQITEDNHLRCPQCDPDETYHWTHLGPIDVSFKDDVITVGWLHSGGWPDKGHPTISHRLVTNPWRGSQVRIHCTCENGHLFDFVLQFHKGITYWVVEPVEHTKDEWRNFHTLWRD